MELLLLLEQLFPLRVYGDVSRVFKFVLFYCRVFGLQL